MHGLTRTTLVRSPAYQPDRLLTLDYNETNVDAPGYHSRQVYELVKPRRIDHWSHWSIGDCVCRRDERTQTTVWLMSVFRLYCISPSERKESSMCFSWHTSQTGPGRASAAMMKSSVDLWEQPTSANHMSGICFRIVALSLTHAGFCQSTYCPCEWFVRASLNQALTI